MRGYEGVGWALLSSSANDCGVVIGRGGALGWRRRLAAVVRDRLGEGRQGRA